MGAAVMGFHGYQALEYFFVQPQHPQGRTVLFIQIALPDEKEHVLCLSVSCGWPPYNQTLGTGVLLMK